MAGFCGDSLEDNSVYNDLDVRQIYNLILKYNTSWQRVRGAFLWNYVVISIFDNINYWHFKVIFLPSESEESRIELKLRSFYSVKSGSLEKKINLLNEWVISSNPENAV